MKPFTIVGYWSDTNEPYTEHIDAKDWKDALYLLAQDREFSEDLVICGVFEGNLIVVDDFTETKLIDCFRGDDS